MPFSVLVEILLFCFNKRLKILPLHWFEPRTFALNRDIENFITIDLNLATLEHFPPHGLMWASWVPIPETVVILSVYLKTSNISTYNWNWHIIKLLLIYDSICVSNSNFVLHSLYLFSSSPYTWYLNLISNIIV